MVGEIIEKSWVDNRYTFYKIGGQDSRTIKFDHTYIKWMKALRLLVMHISEERDKRSINIDKMMYDSKYQFFGLAESVASQLMYFFIKDELSECNGNKELDWLCYHMFVAKNSDPFYDFHMNDTLPYDQFKNYLKKLVVEDFNTFIVGQFYDFYVSYWSCFEACINLICEPYEEKIRVNLNNSQFEAMKKFLNKLCGDQPRREEIIIKFDEEKEKFNKVFGKYVSFPDKYTYLIREVIGDKYTRDLKRDREFLEFCGALRNTVHNNGLHLKADKEIEVKENIFRLRKGEKFFLDDFSKIFILAEELFDIYVAIIDGLSMQLAGGNPVK